MAAAPTELLRMSRVLFQDGLLRPVENCYVIACIEDAAKTAGVTAWPLLSVIGRRTVDARVVGKQRDRDLDEQTSKVAILREMWDRAGGSNDPGGKCYRSLPFCIFAISRGAGEAASK